MPHINVTEGIPGIRSLLIYRPETAVPLSQLAQVLLHDAHSLAAGERELIAAYVSHLNECDYCERSHAAIARHHLDSDAELVACVVRDPEQAPVSDKLKSLLAIAGAVQRGGKHVTPEHVRLARERGATDIEIHDTVLIAAAFCMYNRYVDGLDTWTPDDPEMYDRGGKLRAAQGYLAALAPVAVKKF